jgi:transposase
MEGESAAPREQVCSRLKKRQRRAWQPGPNDHLIYQWVKFDGMTQVHAAADFGISQSTVSRIIDRYERWQAHADDREGGRLDPAERLRAQRWLTYERNERILASALRIADRMEGVTESWKTVRTKPQSQWHKEGTEIRSEEQSVDRHGVAARFLRLAFRVNMEQLKLVEQQAPPRPEPLSAAELAAEDQRDAAVTEDLAAAERRAEKRIAAAIAASAGTTSRPGEAPTEMGGELPAPREQVCAGLSTAEADNLHKVHSGEAADFGASASPLCTCAVDAGSEKNSEDPCIGPGGAPLTWHPGEPLAPLASG